MTNLIAPHGGYKNLKSFQTAEIIYDLTVEFCRRFMINRADRADRADKSYKANKTYGTNMTNLSYRTNDQMIQAARSGSRNISEGSQTSGTSRQSELRLLDVARASLEELLADYIAFLRQRSLPLWGKDEAKARGARALAYKTDRTNKTYRSYMADAESAANCLICLINQTNYLLDKQIKSLGKDLVQRGDLKERYREARRDEIIGPIGPIGLDDLDYKKFLKQQGLRCLPNGQVVPDDQQDP